MDTISAVNIALEMFCVFVSLVIIGCLLANQSHQKTLNKLFLWMLIFNVGVLLCDAVTWILQDNTGTLAGIVVRCANVCVYSFGYIIVAIYTDYLITFIGMRKPVNRRIVRVISGLCVVAVVLVLVSQVNHMYYHFDERNIYHRGDWYWLSQVWAIVLMAVNAVIVLANRKVLSRREIIVLLSYEILPIIAMSIQIMVYGLTLLYVSTTMAMFIIYASIQITLEGQLQAQEQELVESRIGVMLSQIQPHFLYNSLVTIKQLCDIDLEQAKDAIMDFSDYLRANLDSLTRKEPEPFTQELKHIRAYVALEKRRFGDRLQVEFDIDGQDFLLPALTLQPVVENAIRHGIMKREEGGTVTISTQDMGEDWQISVVDDGIGFDPEAVMLDGARHIGLNNTRNRLKSMCDGDMRVQSAPGMGTTVTFTIPKGGA